MKVILLSDVQGTGKKGQIVNVSDGHAKNYLIPRKLAAEATKQNVNDLEGQKKSAEHKRSKESADAQALASRIESATVKILMKVGENGKMYGSVTNKEICEALSKQANIEVDRKKIVLAEPFKTTGTHQVLVKLYSEVSARLTFTIEAEA